MSNKKRDIHLRIIDGGLYYQILTQIKAQCHYATYTKALKHAIVNAIAREGNGFVLVDDTGAKCRFLQDGEHHLKYHSAVRGSKAIPQRAQEGVASTQERPSNQTITRREGRSNGTPQE